MHIKIKNNISGGEKTRLVIAIKLFKLLILDEPEQGCDTFVAKIVLIKILNLCNNSLDKKMYPKITKKINCNNVCIIPIIITHLCDCILNKLHIEGKTFVKIMMLHSENENKKKLLVTQINDRYC